MIGGIFTIGFISGYLFLLKKNDVLISLLISSISACVFVYILKLIVARDRPELTSRLVLESGFSFPSGHSTTAFIAFPILAIVVYNISELTDILKFSTIFRTIRLKFLC
jgi:membrane-associated phospholipid phosphatase